MYQLNYSFNYSQALTFLFSTLKKCNLIHYIFFHFGLLWLNNQFNNPAQTTLKLVFWGVSVVFDGDVSSSCCCQLTPFTQVYCRCVHPSDPTPDSHHNYSQAYRQSNKVQCAFHNHTVCTETHAFTCINQ